MVMEDVFNNYIYPNFKQYVEQNSIYSPLVTPYNPLESKIFPIVPVQLLPVTNRFNNLSYGEQTYIFSIEINVYTQDRKIGGMTISKRTVSNEIIKHIVDYFNTNFRVTVQTELDLANIDPNVHRSRVLISGILDTKYGLDHLVIYPK